MVLFDADGEEIGEKTIRITVTDPDGRVPEGSGGASNTGDGELDSAVAEALAAEAGICSPSRTATTGGRCQDGTGGYSTGDCWGFVWGALRRAGVATEADGNRLGAAGPCSEGVFNRSAYGFRCNADANPSVLLSSFGMERADIPPTQAPRGAIIAWDRGCMGYSSEHGHIEVSMGNGIACSDFCDTIVGDPECASVYIPVE